MKCHNACRREAFHSIMNDAELGSRRRRYAAILLPISKRSKPTMEPLHHEEYWNIEIEWSRPKTYERLLDEGSPHDDLAHLYLISARMGTDSPKAIYVGKTYDQWVSKRLSQPDHKRRYAEFIIAYPRHNFYVSHGIVKIQNGKLTRKRIDDIERILIYVNEPLHAHNVQNFWQHSVTTPYQIENRGSRCTLPRTIALRVFVAY